MLTRTKVLYGIPRVLSPQQTPSSGVFLNISFAFGDDPPFKSYIRKMVESEVVDFLNDANLITKLDPLLGQNKVQIIYFPADESSKNMTFVYIEGTRCKSDGLNKRCWSNPSFCLGWEQFCFEADDKFSLCNNQALNSDINYYKTSSLVDSSKLLWAEPQIMTVIEHKQTEAELIEGEQLLYDWQCLYLKDDLKPRNITDVFCTTIPEPYSMYSIAVDKTKYSSKFLKSASG